MNDDHRNGEANGGPIFLYSGFRASSTWLWSKFRAHVGLLCYYEPFNEQLANLTLTNIGEARPGGWRSHHPDGAPYDLEYAGLLDALPGVPGFAADMAHGQRYVDSASPDAVLDEDIRAYIDRLISHARLRDRVPLLSCTRMLGRAGTLRAAFGGYHILLVRNLFHQWNSYAGQARFGNWYFLHALYETLWLADRDPVIARLRQFFTDESCATFETWVAPENFDAVFCYFVGFHLHFLATVRQSSDIVLDMGQLAVTGSAYRQEMTDKIAGDVGIRLNLDDVEERVDLPLHALFNREACVILVDEIAAAIKTIHGADAAEQTFIDELVASLWHEHGLFTRHTAGAMEYLDRLEAGLQRDGRDAPSNQDGRVSGCVAEAPVSNLEREALMQQSHVAEDREAASGALLSENIVTLRRIEEQLDIAATEATRQLADVSTTLAEREAQLATLSNDLGIMRTERAALQVRLRSAEKDAVELQGRFADREIEIDRMHSENEDLRAAMIQAQAGAERDRMRLDILERAFVRVDLANIALAGRLAGAERQKELLERQRTDEVIGQLQPVDQVGRANVQLDGGRLLHHVLDITARRRLRWALLPTAIWRRLMSNALSVIPEFEAGREAT